MKFPQLYHRLAVCTGRPPNAVLGLIREVREELPRLEKSEVDKAFDTDAFNAFLVDGHGRGTVTGDLTASGLALFCVALIARGSRRGVAARALELGAAPYTAPDGSAGGVCPVTNETTLWRALTRTFEVRRLFARARFVSGSTDRWCAQMLFELEDQPGVPVSSVFRIPKRDDPGFYTEGTVVIPRLEPLLDLVNPELEAA
jgi:hypothetical protein